MTVRQCNDPAEWDELVRSHGGHPLQLWGWGELKSAHNWQAQRYVIEEQGRVAGGAQVLRRATPGPFRSLYYVPRGPVGEFSRVLPELTEALKAAAPATHVSIEPHAENLPYLQGWKKVPKAILLPRTIILDLKKTDDELLGVMSKKTRQYIRKSAKDGVQVRLAASDEIPACLDIYRDTAKRADFALHDDRYYLDLHQHMGEASAIYVAEYDDQIVAFLWLVFTPQVAFELYGGVTDEGQRTRANYTLKWETIKAMRAKGIAEYDMNGLLNDGVSGFKQGFANHETMLAGTYDYPLSPWYGPWHTVFPLAKKAMQTISSLRK